MGSDLLLAALLTVLWRARVKPEGTVLALYVLIYSVTRGVLELWRGDAERGVYFGGHLSTSQIFCIAGVVVGSVLLVRVRMPGASRAPVA
jgi:prolipoprotein diacylglyceryltransferase